MSRIQYQFWCGDVIVVGFLQAPIRAQTIQQIWRGRNEIQQIGLVLNFPIQANVSTIDMLRSRLAASSVWMNEKSTTGGKKY